MKENIVHLFEKHHYFDFFCQNNFVKMERFGDHIRRLRENRGEPLRKVAAYLDIDQAILSKIERNQRKLKKALVEKLAVHFEIDKKELLVKWMTDRVLQEIEHEEYAGEVLKVAEEQVAYQRYHREDRKAIIRKIEEFFQKDERVQRAWIFGSFARGDDKPGSDIDIVVEENGTAKFNYFDLADVQYRLEKMLNRKVDIGFFSSLKEQVAATFKKEAKMIYEIT